MSEAKRLSTIPSKRFLYFAEGAKRLKQNTKNKKKQKYNIHYNYNAQLW
jgi:hypothetical protein